MKLLIVIMAMLVCCMSVVAACGTPRPKSAAEIAQEKRQADQQAARDKAKKAADAKRKEAADAAKARAKAAEEAAKRAAMPRTPPGIFQMDSTHFLVREGFEQNIRGRICTADGGSNSPPGIEQFDAAPNSNDMIVTCRNPEHQYANPPITTKPVTAAR